MTLPILLTPAELDTANKEELLLIDVRSAEEYSKGHIANAVNIPPAKLCSGIQPATGKLPSRDQLEQLLQSIGLTPDKHVVAYDDAGSTWAGRMIWTLDLVGHEKSSILDGGIAAWIADNYPLVTDTPIIEPGTMKIDIDQSLIASYEDILDHLGDDNYLVWDTRTLEEYRGEKKLAEKAGHIPGAIHLEWIELTQPDNCHKLRKAPEIQALLDEKGLEKDKTIVTHCQTHRRSGLTYFVAKKLLQYPSIKAYPGSWSEWGNLPDSPIET